MGNALGAMGRVEAALGSFDADGQVLARWRGCCLALVESGVVVPSEVPRWVWRLDRGEADDVLRGLVGLAQDGDEAALFAVVACMRPGLLVLVRQWMVSVDEVVGLAARRVLELPLSSRRNVAGGLVLDVRNLLWRSQRESAAAVPVDPLDLQSDEFDVPVAEGDGWSAGEELLELVRTAWAQGAVTGEQARLVIETRLFGDDIAVAAQRRGISTAATYKRRERAEALLADTCGAWAA